MRKDGTWLVEHRENETAHSHPPTLTPSSRPIHRRANHDAPPVNTFDTDAKIGIRADQTLARLRAERSDTSVIASDIYNERQRSVGATLGARSRIEHLVCLMRGPEYRSAIQMNAEGHVTSFLLVERDTGDLRGESRRALDGLHLQDKHIRHAYVQHNRSGRDEHYTHVAQVSLRGDTEPELCGLSISSRICWWSGRFQVLGCSWSTALLNALERVFHRLPVLFCICISSRMLRSWRTRSTFANSGRRS